jgi:hypothetical protein
MMAKKSNKAGGCIIKSSMSLIARYIFSLREGVARMSQYDG